MEHLYTTLKMLPNAGNRIDVLCGLGTDSYGVLGDGKTPGGDGGAGVVLDKSELYVE